MAGAAHNLDAVGHQRLVRLTAFMHVRTQDGTPWFTRQDVADIAELSESGGDDERSAKARGRDVTDVMRCARQLRVAAVTTLTAATTMPVGPVEVAFHKAWRDRDRWTTLVRFRRPVAGMVEAGELRTIDVYSIFTVEPTAERFEPLLADPGTGWLPFDTPVRAVIEHDHTLDWLFDRVEVESRTAIGDGRIRSEITIGGVGPLGVLLLRLGPGATLAEPEELSMIQSDLARRMLAVYEASSGCS